MLDLERGPESAEEREVALDGHICRCTGYFPIKVKILKFKSNCGLGANHLRMAIFRMLLENLLSLISKT